ncbi:MAG TPA: EF-P lysine aminoacylase EpmA [Bdellovibrionales bacterium]|nr:EF-P lysine aminoacylase EpmA [Bdellovibrionales bacterium]
MSNRARTQFLEEIWTPYPPANAGWKDVSSFEGKALSETIVCGRIKKIDLERCEIEANGSSLTFSFAKDSLSWLAPQRIDEGPAPDLFKIGDILAVALIDAGGALVAKSVLLLCPGLTTSEPRKFDVQQSVRWADFVSRVRSFFVEKGFIEAATPTLVPSPGTEPFLDPFKTEWEIGSKKRTFYLPTSPEFHLKKMLSRGWTKIFEVKPCFRNGEIGEHHQPEFTMLEWYRAYANLDSIADDVELLLKKLSSVSMRRTTMRDLFRERLSFDLRPNTSLAELQALAQRERIGFSSDDSWDDVFFRIFLEKIEKDLGTDGPLLVRGYPPSQAALSRIGEDGFADRFEVYWRGLELANAFHELNDPRENEARFGKDAEGKAALGKSAVPVDEELLTAIRSGMPPSGGIALGMDRLFMAIYEIDEIEKTRAFPMTRPC